MLDFCTMNELTIAQCAGRWKKPKMATFRFLMVLISFGDKLSEFFEEKEILLISFLLFEIFSEI